MSNLKIRVKENFTTVFVVTFLFALIQIQAFSQTAIPYSSYIGGSQVSNNGLETFSDDTGIYYLGGTSQSAYYTTAGAYQTTYGGGSNDMVLTKVGHDGQVIWSTFIGGVGADYYNSTYSDRGFLVEEDAIYIAISLSNAETLSGFTALGPIAGFDGIVAKFDAVSGALQWGSILPDLGIHDIYVDEDKIYLGAEGGSGATTTSDALESTGVGGYYAILDATTGSLDYASFFQDGVTNEINQVVVFGNTLAFGGGDISNSLQTTADAFFPVSENSYNSFLAYFDLTTRQISYTTYMNYDPPGSDFRNQGYGIVDLQTDGTKLYVMNYGSGRPYVTPGELDMSYGDNPWVQVWNGTNLEMSSSLGVADVYSPFPYLKVDTTQGRWLVYGHGDANNYVSVDPLPGHVEMGGTGDNSAWVMEREIGSNTILFHTSLADNNYSTLNDVVLDGKGNMYLVGVEMNEALLENGLITSDAFATSSTDGHNFLLKLDSNRDVVYGTYLWDAGYSRGNWLNLLPDGTLELFGFANNNTLPLTDNAEFTYGGSGSDANYYYTQLTCCPELTDNTIATTQTVCINGLAQVIQGSDVFLNDTLYADLNGSPQTGQAAYQWQSSFDNSNWEDIAGATERDFLPAPTSVDVFFRRLAGSSLCRDTSNIHSVVVNALAAPSLTEGETTTCPATSIAIGAPATGGTNTTYSYQWSPSAGLDFENVAQPNFTGMEGAIYVVTVTDDGNGCQYAENWQVNVDEADAGIDMSFCDGLNGPLIGTPGVVGGNYTYSWASVSGDPASTLNSTTTAQPTATPTQTTEYELTMTIISAGCSSKDTVLVGVSDPMANAGLDTVLCMGESVILGGEATQAGYTYGWAPGIYIDDQNIAQPTFYSSLCPLDDGIAATNNPLEYTLTKIDDVTGCTDVDTVNIYLLQLDLFNEFSCPPVQIGTRDEECGLGLPGVTFTWSVVSGDFASLAPGDVNLEYPTVNPTVRTVYQLEVCLNGKCCTDLVTVASDCVSGCSILVEASSAIVCPVGGQYDTEIYATGTVNGASLDNLPPDYDFRWVPTTALATPDSTYTAVNTLIGDQKYYFEIYRISDDQIICQDSIIVFAAPAANPIVDLEEIIYACPETAGVNIGVPTVFGWSYQWSPTTGLDDPFISNPTATYTADTEYEVTATDMVTGCVYRDTIELKGVSPVADAGPDRSFCDNAIVSFGTTPQPHATYAWAPTAGLADPTTPIQLDTLFASVSYYLTVTDTLLDCISQDTVNFTLSSPPIYDAPDMTVCEGGSVQIGLAEQPGYSYFWSPSNGLSDANVAQPIATISTTTTYSVTVSDGNAGCYVADDVTVTVINSSFTLDLPNVEACEGATLVPIGTTDQGGTYNWTPATGLSDPNISNPTVTIPISPVVYTLNWLTPDGCTLNDEVTVGTYDEPAFNPTMSYNICDGESVTIGLSEDVSGATFTWSSISGDPASTLSSTSIYNPEATPTQTTIYQLAYTSPNGCMDTKDITVTVSESPILDLGLNQTVCGDFNIVPTITLPGNIGGGDYSESFEAGLGGWVQAINGTEDDYDWIRDSGGTPSGNTGPTTGADGDWYLFTEASSRSNSNYTITSPDITLSATTTDMSFGYHMYGGSMGSLTMEASTNGGTSWTQLWALSSNQGNQWNKAIIDMSAYTGLTIKIRFVGITGGGFTSDMAIDNILFPANTQSPIASYGWSTAETTDNITVNPIEPTTYSLTLTSSEGCIVTDDITLSPPYTIDVGTDKTICAGASATIGTPDQSGGTLNYVWSISSGPGPLPSPSNTAQIEVEPTGTTVYLLTVNDGGGCIKTDNVTVNVDTGIEVDLGPNQTVCINGCVTIGVTAQSGHSYQWVPTMGISDPSQNSITVCPTSNSSYELIVTNTSTGCVSRDEIQLTIGTDTAPTANAGSDVEICSDGIVQIGNTPVGSLTYSWSPTTGLSDPNSANPSITLSNATTATVSHTYILTVIDQVTFCQSMDTVTVNVLPNIVTWISGTIPTLCEGSGTSINASVSSSTNKVYSWLPAALFEDPTVQDPVITELTANTDITLIVTDTLTGCTGNVSTTINVLSSSIYADAGPDLEVCVGEETIIGMTEIPGSVTGPEGGTDYLESFETDLGGWIQSTAPDDADNWIRDSGGTPTGSTGPSSGQDGNWYLFTEGSSSAGQVHIITSPDISLSGSTTDMSFGYHMYGSNMGTLTLEVSTDGGSIWNQLWTLSGNQGNQWVNQVVDVSAYTGTTIKIRFVGTVGNTRSDMAIDDIRFPAKNQTIHYTYAWSSASIGSTFYSTSSFYYNGSQNESMANVKTSSASYDRTHRLIVTDISAGCQSIDEVTVIINPQETVEAGRDQFLCTPNSTNLNASALMVSSSVGNWTQESGPTMVIFADISDPNTNISNLTTGVYQFRWTVTGTEICNSGDFDLVNIEIAAPPVLNTNLTCDTNLTAARVTTGSILDGAVLTYWLDTLATVQIPDPTNVSKGTYYIQAYNTSTGCEAVMFALVEYCDWGDLPDTSAGITASDYQTLEGYNGPVHIINSAITLGNTIDAEGDGQQSTDALGDGTDEDGLLIMESLDVRRAGTIRIPLSYTNTTESPVHIEAWIDWNNNGAFDMGEMVLDVTDPSAGLYDRLEVTIPSNAEIGAYLGLRIRISNQDNMTPYGLIDGGEVEDYLIGIECPIQICVPIDAMMRK